MKNTNIFYILARQEPENTCLHGEDGRKVNTLVLIAPKVTS